MVFELPHLPGGRALPGGKRLHALLMNIGSGGICFKTQVLLPRGLVVRVNLPMNGPSLSAPTLVEVLWVKKAPGRKEYRTGLRYIL